jgi:hypothetical protein
MDPGRSPKGLVGPAVVRDPCVEPLSLPGRAVRILGCGSPCSMIAENLTAAGGWLKAADQ